METPGIAYTCLPLPANLGTNKVMDGPTLISFVETLRGWHWIKSLPYLAKILEFDYSTGYLFVEINVGNK